MLRTRHKPVLKDSLEWQLDDVLHYYRQTGQDYSAWSEKLHMHFGYYRGGWQFNRREEMLDEMVRQMFERLALTTHSTGVVLDVGCGVGPSLRIGAACFPNLQWKGVTIVPEQVSWGTAINEQLGFTDRVTLQLDNFEALSLPSNSIDYAYGLESISHARFENKSQYLSELYRVLKPGGRVAIADGCIMHSPSELPRLLRACHDELCRGWALPVMAVAPAVLQEMQHIGFREIQLEDISWRVAPSVAHIPLVTLGFLWDCLRSGEKLSPSRRNHLKACVLTGIIGLARRHCSYCLFSAVK